MTFPPSIHDPYLMLRKPGVHVLVGDENPQLRLLSFRPPSPCILVRHNSVIHGKGKTEKKNSENGQEFVPSLERCVELFGARSIVESKVK